MKRSDLHSSNHSKQSVFLPVFICAVAIPVSMVMWIGNLAFSFLAYSKSSIHDELGVIPPFRWLMATIIPLMFIGWGTRKKSLSKSGAFLGMFVGFILTLTSYSFLFCLIAFFVTSSKATKFRSIRKRKIEFEFKEGGQRNWLQVFCNGGMATQLALLYLLDVGCGERAINFLKDYRSSWLGIGILGAFSCCNGDTWASELGTVIGYGDPILITSLKKVPRGTNGGVTLQGLIFSLLGGTVIGASYYLSVLYFVDSSILSVSPPQWPLVAFGAVGGFLGSFIDSVLGATMQYSGIDEKSGCIVEHSGKGIRHISGRSILDNHSVNLISSIATGLLLPRIASAFWP